MTDVTDKGTTKMHYRAIDRVAGFALELSGAADERVAGVLRGGRCLRGIFGATTSALVCAVALVGCDGGSTPVTPHSSSTTTPVTAARSSARAVLAAYRAGWSAYERALSTADAYDPQLAATMTNPLLQKVRATLLGDKNAGVIGRGSVQLHPKVTSLSSSSAVVVDCMYSASELVYASTGKPVPPVTPPEQDGVRATVVRVGTVWKVSQQSVTEGKCPAGA